jgi:cell division protein ZapA (FtsZ GTPase activity inhibitor)
LIQQVKVSILGQEYTIHTKADREYVQKVAEHLASRCQEAENSLRSSSLATIALLAAMNITSDYLQLKKSHEHLLARIKNQQDRLASVLS